MPKRVGGLFDSMFTLDALHSAYVSTRTGKRCKYSVMAFERNLGANLQELLEELEAGTYTPRPYKSFEVFEPKPRVIHAPHFRDVVVQRAMYATLYPLMDKTFLVDSFGCRLGYGTHKASNKVQQYLRESGVDSYTLQMDIRKFFYRIDRTILLALWKKKIKDKRVLCLLEQFTDYEGTGIPIGNLMSQVSALVYLNALDHFVKRELGVKKYVRYVDDFIIFDLTKTEAHELLTKIRNFLATELKLELSKYGITKTQRGVNFCGFRTWRRTRFIRKHSLLTFKRAVRRGKTESIISCLGHAKATASYSKMLNLALASGTQLPQSLLKR